MWIATTNDQTVSDPQNIAHPIVREFFRLHNIKGGWDIHSSADIDGGSGLGSSGAFTVALMTAFLGMSETRGNRAEEAYMLEGGISLCGPQDHYAATFGGCNAFTFAAADESHGAPPERLDSTHLLKHLQMFDTGLRRDADTSLLQVEAAPIEHLHRIKKLGYDVADALRKGDPFPIANHMREHWTSKRKTQSVPQEVNEMWEAGMNAGACAGKLVGAGGGGFMLFFTPPYMQASVKLAMKGHREITLRPGKGVQLLEWESYL